MNKIKNFNDLLCGGNKPEELELTPLARERLKKLGSQVKLSQIKDRFMIVTEPVWSAIKDWYQPVEEVKLVVDASKQQI